MIRSALVHPHPAMRVAAVQMLQNTGTDRYDRDLRWQLQRESDPAVAEHIRNVLRGRRAEHAS